MPLIQKSDYKAPLLLRNAHLNTVYAALARKVKDVFYERERIETPDKDFLDLDWSFVKSDQLVIVLHGLEGSADRPYMRGMIKAFNNKGWDGLAFNFRGCSGVINRQPYSYHMGWTTDLEFVVDHVLSINRYREIVLVGFSLGGNVVLNYLGKYGNTLPKAVKKGIAFSVPCHIESANIEIDKAKNSLYLKRFMNSLNEKAAKKAESFPNKIQFDVKNPPKNFYQFDDQFTAPLNGFKNNFDYWTKSSSLNVIPQIEIPTLLVNALDDTFLSYRCFPVEMAEKHQFFHFEAPKHGGHVGFISFNNQGSIWSEKRALAFADSKK
ncbi:MAG: alpha/beta fold hydrolase [Bacteroidetes bacterium]|jgi:predicted alpha/beta-fold hydrolase|nr:alpha/beta fold hydrolase [Bacteroidota bacterium]